MTNYIVFLLSATAGVCKVLPAHKPRRSWAGGSRSRAGEQEAEAGEHDAGKLSGCERPCFRSEETKAVDEHGDGGDDEEIEDEGLGRAKPRSDQGEADEDARPQYSAGDGF